MLFVLQSPRSFCSVHNRPIYQEKRCLCFPALFGRSEDLEDGELGSQRTIEPRLAFSLLLYQKRRGVWLVGTDFLVSEFFVLEPIQLDQVMMFFDCVDHNKLWKILKEMGIPDDLTCLLRNLYTDQEATVRTRKGITHWFQIGKGVRQGCTLSPCLFNCYAEYIMRNTGLDETQAGIKIARRNVNNLRYADDTTRMAESEEELKSLLMKVRKVKKLA